MMRVQLDSLVSESHGFLAHPFSLHESPEDEDQFLARLRALRAGPRLGAEEFSQRAVGLLDSHLGVFGEITEQDFTQLPIHVTQATVADPVGLLGAGSARPVVTGAGLDFAAARYQAALRAVAVYSSLMVDPRRLLTADGHDLLSSPADSADALAKLRSGEMDGAVRAIGLADGRPRLLAADLVFPALRTPSLPYTVPCGAAAAYSWSEALEAGLVQHCRRLTIAEALASGRRFHPVDLQTGELDETAEYCQTTLESVGERVTVYDVTGSLGVPTFACALAGEVVAYGCATSATDALRDGLQQVLLYYQAQANNEWEYAPEDVPDLPSRLRTSDVRPVTSPPPLDVDTLARRLAHGGHAPAAVPLDHDQGVGRIMPYIARVVVGDVGS